jgi:hydrogenase expression/formation protein HypE
MIIEENRIPVREDVRGACEILGLDPLYVANEGKFLAFVAPDHCDTALKALRQHPLGIGAEIIGEVVSEHPKLVRMRTLLGGSRVVEMMSGEQLPRIC